MKTPLFNTAHPLAETGKPIFIPFGEWKYDATRRQRLDRAHGERIANELNERVARGEPGIPVYQGHPDVPELASKYPDKGALGWVTKIELANEGGKEGLALTVEWDRDPGKGFKWFSPYWFANESEGNVHIVGSISSIGLVNNPNIAEFRLANEDLTQRRGGAEKVKLRPEIVELAAKFDRIANEANFDESKHPRANDGKFTSGGGGSGGGSGEGGSTDGQTQAKEKLKLMLKSGAVSIDKGGRPTKDDVVFEYNHKMYYIGKDSEHMVQEFADRGLVKRVRGYHNIGGQGRPKEKSDDNDSNPIPHPILRERETKQRYALWKELAAKYAKTHQYE